MPSWLKVEFDQQYDISEVAVVWGEVHNQRFEISLSPDDVDWTVVVPSMMSDTDAGYSEGEYHENRNVVRQSFSIVPTSAKFIKIDITETSSPPSHIFKAMVNELEAII